MTFTYNIMFGLIRHSHLKIWSTLYFPELCYACQKHPKSARLEWAIIVGSTLEKSHVATLNQRSSKVTIWIEIMCISRHLFSFVLRRWPTENWEIHVLCNYVRAARIREKFEYMYLISYIDLLITRIQRICTAQLWG